MVIVKSAWSVPTYCHELGFEVCNVLRETSGLAHLVKLCDEHINKNSHDRHLQDKLTFEAASLIEQSLSTENRAYIVANGIDKVGNQNPDGQLTDKASDMIGVSIRNNIDLTR